MPDRFRSVGLKLSVELESSDAPASPAYFPDGTEQEREVAAATP